MSHEHSHGCEHESTDIDNALEMGIQYSLFEKIDMENLECLNEETDGTGKTIFKSFEKRLDFDKVITIWQKIFLIFFCFVFLKFVQSDADEELLFNIPFTGNIKLKGFRIIGADDGSHPNKVKLSGHFI